MEIPGKSPRSRQIVAAQAAGEPQSNPATETVKAGAEMTASTRQLLSTHAAIDHGNDLVTSGHPGTPGCRTTRGTGTP